eukprot:469453-Pelagomonas_calceolata.AAC.2
MPLSRDHHIANAALPPPALLISIVTITITHLPPGPPRPRSMPPIRPPMPPMRGPSPKPAPGILPRPQSLLSMPML